MSPNTSQYQQRPLEDVLDFCVELSRRMIASGASLERIQSALEHICRSYELSEVSIFLLNTHIMISARDKSGYYASRQSAIRKIGIHLEQLNLLNDLCYRIAQQTPSTDKLMELLENASETHSYSDLFVLLAKICSMSSLCMLFGGDLRDVFSVALLTVLLHYLMIIIAIPRIDRIITNAIDMWIVTAAVFLLMKARVVNNVPVVLVTISILVIPGISMVNSMRNLLCGNELNGLLQSVRTTVETLALTMGIYIAIQMFGSEEALSETLVIPMTDPTQLILVSFLASCSFGAVFRIRPRDIPLAGLGGVLSRITLLALAPHFPPHVYITASAFAASLYAEILATIHKKPSSYYTYPSVIPLLPGRYFYYAMVGLHINNREMLLRNGVSCVLSLTAMSVGFVLSYVLAQYIRNLKIGKRLRGRS